jgi:hypothetical protein
MKLQNHRFDPVGVWVGWNANTGGNLADGDYPLVEFAHVSSGSHTVHSCYGFATAACQKFWQDSPAQQAALVPVRPYH